MTRWRARRGRALALGPAIDYGKACPPTFGLRLTSNFAAPGPGHPPPPSSAIATPWRERRPRAGCWALAALEPFGLETSAHATVASGAQETPRLRGRTVGVVFATGLGKPAVRGRCPRPEPIEPERFSTWPHRKLKASGWTEFLSALMAIPALQSIRSRPVAPKGSHASVRRLAEPGGP